MSEPLDAAAENDVEQRADADQLSLSNRLRQPRTIISILIPLAVIGVFVGINGAQLTRVPVLIAKADLRLVGVAFLVFYAGFPLRGLRWAVLLRGTGTHVSTRDSTEIIFLSWLVNCVVPAKLGDVYRAYLLKINSSASLSRTFGTVFIERVLDLIAIALLGIAAGFWSFRDGLPPPIQLIFAGRCVSRNLADQAKHPIRWLGRQGRHAVDAGERDRRCGIDSVHARQQLVARIGLQFCNDGCGIIARDKPIVEQELGRGRHDIGPVATTEEIG